MKIKQRFLSLVLAVVLLIPSAVPTVFASEDAVIYVNEVFDNFATNDIPLNLKVDKGTDGRVVMRDDAALDKAAYAKAMKSTVLMSVPLSGIEDKYVVSADIMVDGARTDGAVFAIKGSANIPLINYSKNGTVTLNDGYRVGGYRIGEWNTYTFVINRTKNKFDFYLNGKRKVSNWYFADKFSGESALTFGIAKPNDAEYAELLVDNIRAYSGTDILGEAAFPKVQKNDAEYPFEPTPPPEIGSTVFMMTSGKTGFTPVLAPKTGTAEFAPLPDEEQLRLHLARPAGTNTDVFADIVFSGTEEVVHYVWQLDVYPAKMASGMSSFLGTLIDGSNANHAVMRLYNDGQIKCGNTTLMTIPMKKWSTVAVAVKLDSQTIDAYLNGELVAKDVPADVAEPVKARVSLVVGNGEMDMYYDNFRLYEGSEPRDVSNEKMEMGAFIAVGENRDDAVDIMGDGSVVFATENDTVYYNEEKTSYSALGTKQIVENDILFVDTELVSKVLGKEVNYDAASGEITVDSAKTAIGKNVVNIDGKDETLDAAPFVSDTKAYVPIASFAQKALKKFVYSDERGWVLVSNLNRGLSNDPNIAIMTEKSDIVDRFIQFDRPSAEKLYNDLVAKSYKQHPRLFVTPDQVTILKENIKNNEVMAKWARNVIAGADNLLKKAPVVYEIPDGLRLFLSCLEVRERLYQYSVAYLISDDIKYAEGAWKEIENACNWQDWNVSRHYLDSGKIGPGMALAYDVFYHVFTDEQKAFMREKVTQHYLEYTAGAYTGANAHKGMLTNSSNWGAVCNGSVLMWCLATMDEEAEDSEYTELTKFLGSCALKGIEYPITLLYPAGAWAEGLGYFSYVIEYTSWAALSLTNSCGTDYNLLAYPGLLEMSDYAVYIQTPGHGYFNFGDGATISEAIQTPPEVFLQAKLTDNQELNDLWYNFRFNLLGDNMKTLDILFYTPGDTAGTDIKLPLDKVFGGLEVTTMKSDFSKLTAPYAAALAGDIHIAEHFHAGQFIYEALGQRWAVDLGKDDYNIEGGYYGAAGLTLYRRRSEGHNVLVINPDETPGQKVGSMGFIEKMESKPRGAISIYNLDDCYSENTTSMKRGFYFGDDRNTLTVQDEFTLKKSGSDVYWFMHTKADIEVAEDGKSAILTQNGQKLKIEFASNLTQWHIEARDAVPMETTPERPGQYENTGVTKVTLVGKGSRDCYITAKLIPVEERVTYPAVSYVPISQWTIPDGEIEPLMNLTSINIDGKNLTGFDVMTKEYVYSTTDTSHIPVITATATKGNISITQASAFDEYAVITLTDGVETLTYKIKIEEGLIDSLLQSDESLRTPDGAAIKQQLVEKAVEPSAPVGMRRLPVSGFYALDAQTGNPAEHVFDKNFSTRWASDVQGAYIVADLGSIRKIDGVTFAFFDGANRQYKFEIQISNDNQNYTTVYSGYSTGTTNNLESLSFTAEARYVRFVGYGHKSGEWNNMTEFSPFIIE